jgi:multidrug efflux pump subunit AcrA (membrane-fusion protein)
VGTLSAGTRAVFHPVLDPATPIPVDRMQGAAHPWDESTSDIEFQLAPHAQGLTPGMVGWLELPDRPREVVIISSTAVLQSPDGPYVILQQPDGTDAVTRRSIRVGRTSSGQTVVVSGLGPDERILVRGAFFLDAERRVGARGGLSGR